MPGQFESYQARYVEVTASTTFLRESPSTEAAGTTKVVQGDILVELQEEGISDSWYKVLTLDGSASGYLVRDWVNPISVIVVPGDQLSPTLGNRFFTEDYSTGSGVWEPGKLVMSKPAVQRRSAPAQVLVQISYGQSEGLATDMGVMVYLDERDVHARIFIDDFAIDQ